MPKKICDMATTISISSVVSEITTLSKYVGREQRDAKGDSMFETLLVQTRDETLIRQYIIEAAVELEKQLMPFGGKADGSALTISADASNGTLTWTWDATYVMLGGMESLLKKYLVNWAMGAWCGDKVAERAEYFRGEAERLARDIPRHIFRKKPI